MDHRNHQEVIQLSSNESYIDANLDSEGMDDNDVRPNLGDQVKGAEFKNKNRFLDGLYDDQN